MKAFVFWTGWYNIVVGFALFFPVLFRSLGVRFPESVVWSELVGFLAMFLGVMLVWCARDLQARATIVYWEGWLRIVIFLHLGWFGFFGGIGALLGLIGVIDLLIGLTYILGLPGAVGKSHGTLLGDM